MGSNTNFLTDTEILASPANTSCSVAHQLQKMQPEVPSLPGQHTNEGNSLEFQRATWTKENRGERRIIHKYNDARFFTQWKNPRTSA